MRGSSKKLSQSEKVHIEEIIKSAMHDYAQKQVKNIKDKEDMAERLISIIGEYMGAFLLIGYDSNGAPFNIFHATSQLDADAITTALNKMIFKQME
jgi:uncharacterized protein YgfB (UPF0149 family)